jgi:prephenate dehydratase
MNTDPSQTVIACLGPAGTYSEQAAGRFAPGAKTAPQRFFRDVFTAVADQTADYGVVPIENMIEGIVRENLDLLERSGLRVVGELLLPIRHSLSVRPESKQVVKILSHPQALAQCNEYLLKQFPQAEIAEVSSTAEACRQVAEGPAGWAALGPAEAAARFGLRVIAADIGDAPRNVTRFWMIGRTLEIQPTHDKFSIAFRFRRDAAGSLYEALKCFAQRQVNLTSIYSRPTAERLGSYVFHLDAEGNLRTPAVEAALDDLRALCDALEILGSYRGAPSLLFEDRA